MSYPFFRLIFGRVESRILMTSENSRKQSGPISKFVFIIFSETIQAAKTAESSFATANARAFRYVISAKWTDIAFPEFKQVLFF